MKTTDTVLDKIVASKQETLRLQKLHTPQAAIERALTDLPPFTGLGFFEALKAQSPALTIIGEVKKASPSAGLLRPSFSLAEINDAYQAAEQVGAVSIITETTHFQGSEDNLTFFATHNKQRKPLLRKDFLFEPYQILESKLLGAQAYLLIASLFERRELQELIDLGRLIDLEPLVEVHTSVELAMVRQTTARCIGVNARNLKTFTVDRTAHRLLGLLDDSYARVAESGIDGPESLAALTGIADAALIGSYFMQAPNISSAIQALTAQNRGETS